MRASPFPSRDANQFLSRIGGRGDRPLVIAHRGASAHAPENTLLAAQLGLVAGADAWELDVQLTADRVPVVIHDATLTRTTDVATRFRDDPRAGSGYQVSRFTRAEIQSLDAGGWFLAESSVHRSALAFGTRDHLAEEDVDEIRAGRVGVPTLEEALEFTRGENWLVNVELKGDARQLGLVDAVLDLVERMEMLDRVLFSGFEHALLVRARLRSSRAALGALVEEPIAEPARYVLETLQADTYHPSADRLDASVGSSSPPRLDPGVPALTYTVNDLRPDGLARRLASRGVAGLFTDLPAAMRAFLSDPDRAAEFHTQ